MKFVKELTWEEVLQNDEIKTVTILSYGYVEHSIFGGHFEPFRHKREIVFKVNRGFNMLENPTFFLDDDESTLVFQKGANGKIYVDDPDIWSRPDL